MSWWVKINCVAIVVVQLLVACIFPTLAFQKNEVRAFYDEILVVANLIFSILMVGTALPLVVVVSSLLEQSHLKMLQSGVDEGIGQLQRALDTLFVMKWSLAVFGFIEIAAYSFMLADAGCRHKYLFYPIGKFTPSVLLSLHPSF